MSKKNQSINNPDELNKILQKTNPLVWIVLGIVLLLLVALFVWASFTTLDVNVLVDGELIEKQIRPIEFLYGK
ncbi:MAG TPA: hypothetical protein DCR12_03095 [Lachnospiraceae bacterium]|nr:hypothetical protein [Lachnospiraceae bacterium]